MSDVFHIENAIRELRPGEALCLGRQIFARKRDGTWIAVRDSCDEVSPRTFRDADQACLQLVAWHIRVTIPLKEAYRTIPYDVEEIHWMVCVMTHLPF